MTLEFETFRSCAEEFLSLSKTLGDSWIMKTINLNTTDFYLEKRCTVANNVEKVINEKLCGFTDFSVFVYHILYSQSYSVPVLYFNAYHSNGKLLTLEEIWNRIPDCYQKSIDNKWNTISQQEHPKLGVPYFIVHPCNTSNLMSNCKTSNYLISWLSIVGPLVGLSLSTDFAKYVHHSGKAECNSLI